MARTVPVRIPREWSDSWFRNFYAEVLARDATASQADIDAAVNAHNASPDAHGGINTATPERADEAYTFFMAG